MVDQAKKAIDEADLPGKAKNAWDTFKRLVWLLKGKSFNMKATKKPSEYI